MDDRFGIENGIDSRGRTWEVFEEDAGKWRWRIYTDRGRLTHYRRLCLTIWMLARITLGLMAWTGITSRYSHQGQGKNEDRVEAGDNKAY